MRGSDDKPADRGRKRPSARSSPLPSYNVVLLNDEEHSHDYVVEMLQAIFGYPQEVGVQLADLVDNDGRVVVFTAHQELAELKKQFIDDYGADPRIEECTTSMQAIVEPQESD